MKGTLEGHTTNSYTKTELCSSYKKFLPLFADSQYLLIQCHLLELRTPLEAAED